MSQLDLLDAIVNVKPPVQREDSAVFSACGTWRFSLTRELGGERVCAFLGANPSTATKIKNDQTISKDVGFATRWECGRLIKVNVAAYVDRNPDGMFAAEKAGIDVYGGAENERAIREAIAAVRETDGLFVVASGNIIPLEKLYPVIGWIEEGGVTPWCLGMNQTGTPKHPLYLSYKTPLQEYKRR